LNILALEFSKSLRAVRKRGAIRRLLVSAGGFLEDIGDEPPRLVREGAPAETAGARVCSNVFENLRGNRRLAIVRLRLGRAEVFLGLDDGLLCYSNLFEQSFDTLMSVGMVLA